MKRIQLLLADEGNAYQQSLVDAARAGAAEHGLDFLEPRFAEGSMMKQMGQCYDVLRADPRPDGVLLLLVAVDEMENAVSALAKGGVDCVILNRIPAYLERLRRQLPDGCSPRWPRIRRRSVASRADRACGCSPRGARRCSSWAPGRPRRR
jgi:hypothetical protein